MTQHTAGPWKISDTGEDYRPFAIMAGHKCIADVNAEDARDVEAVDAANARLIAAAPDLLAALEALTMRAAALDRSATHDGLQNCEAIHAARAAIAKATQP